MAKTKSGLFILLVISMILFVIGIYVVEIMYFTCSIIALIPNMNDIMGIHLQSEGWQIAHMVISSILILGLVSPAAATKGSE